MSITNFDAFLDEVAIDDEKVEPKGFEIKDTKFDLPDILPAKALLVFARYAERDRVDLAVDTFYSSVLGAEQYEKLLDLVPDIRVLILMVDKIAAFYTGDIQERNEKNVQKVQRGKRK